MKQCMAPITKILVAGLVLLWAGMALAGSGISVHDAWIRMISLHVPAAGYFVVDNDSDHAVELTAVRSPAFADAMLHRSIEKNGQSQMVHVKAISIPAGGHLTLAPSGYHVMLMHARSPLKPGDTVPLTLIFSDGQQVTAQFQVRSLSGQAG